jgi:hypothetical protein
VLSWLGLVAYLANHACLSASIPETAPTAY